MGCGCSSFLLLRARHFCKHAKESSMGASIQISHHLLTIPFTQEGRAKESPLYAHVMFLFHLLCLLHSQSPITSPFAHPALTTTKKKPSKMLNTNTSPVLTSTSHRNPNNHHRPPRTTPPAFTNLTPSFTLADPASEAAAAVSAMDALLARRVGAGVRH